MDAANDGELKTLKELYDGDADADGTSTKDIKDKEMLLTHVNK